VLKEHNKFNVSGNANKMYVTADRNRSLLLLLAIVS